MRRRRRPPWKKVQLRRWHSGSGRDRWWQTWHGAAAAD
ncbi:hypothetical protein ES288_A11G378000v1 [Gossypium darwinii]|uniref:Uncharacterized protein n=1 Tax=Gossypium darwinii TaxID=34276 RepID=A0A5D2ETY4_GOSDA|nr:hypothetical protein ES288_A11G378000v1 [Gossypium darwinii]